jgi:hypothetical protein
VAAVQLGQPVQGELPQPGIEGERPPAEIILKLLDGVGQGLLDRVGWVDTRGQPPVHPHGDHLPQALAVADEQLLPGRRVAVRSLVHQLVGVGFAGSLHGRSPPKTNPAGQRQILPDFFRYPPPCSEVRVAMIFSDEHIRIANEASCLVLVTQGRWVIRAVARLRAGVIIARSSGYGKAGG